MTRKDDLTDGFKAAIDSVGLEGLRATSMFGSNEELDKLDAALASQIGDDVSVIFNHESLFKRSRAAITALRATLADWQSGQTYRYIGRDGKPVLARDLEARAETAEARVAELDGWRPGAPVTLVYTSWKGETAPRRIIPRRIWWGSTEWHPEPQWLVTAFDMDKEAERDFALADFHGTEARALSAEAAALERAAMVLQDEIEIARTAFPQVVPILAADMRTIRALITPKGRTALDAALADARKSGKLEGLREAAGLEIPSAFDGSPVGIPAPWKDAILALAARVEGGDA